MPPTSPGVINLELCTLHPVGIAILLGPVDPFRALSGRLDFTVRSRKFSKDPFFVGGVRQRPRQCPPSWCSSRTSICSPLCPDGIHTIGSYRVYACFFPLTTFVFLLYSTGLRVYASVLGDVLPVGVVAVRVRVVLYVPTDSIP